MSSDGYFDGDDLDDTIFEELDAIEAAALQSTTRPQAQKPTTTHTPLPLVRDEDSFYDLTLDIDESELQKLDDFVKDAYDGKARPVAGPGRTKSATHQTTLFGDVLPSSLPTLSTRSQLQRTKSASRNPFGQQAPKTKVWDQTAFAKTGLKSGKAKGKAKALYDDEELQEEEVEFEQFPAPFVPGMFSITLHPDRFNERLPPPMKLIPDLLEAKHWIYPLNKPKRDYQFNIVKHCLFENTIVALPTGLGKTFIAGVIMLNYYRWFPEGKVVFVAPTKPLVAQQIEACHQTCGIPGGDAAELTGQIPRTARGKLWREKRIFYMTPQTLVNDLTSENCDVRDIVLLVIDEAHRATGDYAYNQVVRFLMAKNPHFRILALTATPGGSPDAVQNLIDGLHISHIEIRDENSLDLKEYIHHKKIEQHIINMSEDVNKVKDLLAALMDKDIKPLKQRGVLYGNPDPVKLHPYAAQARLGQLTKDQRWAYGPLSKLASLARAMGYLIEGTLGMCHTYLHELARAGDEDTAPGPGKAAAASRMKALRNDPMFRAVLHELDSQRGQGFSVHPKMDRLKMLVVQHFGQQLGEGQETTLDQTRVMVFVTFREAVDEIVEALNAEQPLIRAHKFIGQGTDKQGNKGLAQKQQLDVIKRFKEGEFNVLVATSIGEEGLDIGEVDLIVCYDAQKTPIRMLQRLGRTGRKRAGVVHVLLAENREELNLEKAKVTYKEVQKTIVRGEQLELFSDVPRLLPDHVKPVCLEKAMEIQEYVRDEGKKTMMKERRSPTAGTKRKRNDDVSRNIPAGASTGFVSVADLLIKGSKKQKKAKSIPKKDFDFAGEDDDADIDIESGVISVPLRRTKSSVPSSSSKSSNQTDKTTLRRAKTSGLKFTKKKKSKAQPVEPSSSQFSSKGVDDMDDMEIERGLIAPPRSQSPVSTRSFSPEPSCSRKHATSRSPGSSVNAVIDLSDSDDDRDPPQEPAETVSTNDPDQSMAWLVDEDEDLNFEIVDSSPIANRIRRLSPEEGWGHPQPSYKPDESVEFLGMSRPIEEQPSKDLSLSPCFGRHVSEADESVEFVNASMADNERQTTDVLDLCTPNFARNEATPDESLEFVGVRSFLRKDLASSPLWPASSSPVKPIRGRKRGASSAAMPPPPMLSRGLKISSPKKEHEMPQPSFPVRPLAKPRRRLIVESPGLDMPSPSQRRLHRRASPQPQQALPKQQQGGRAPVDAHANPLFDFEAAHSGDEISEGSSGPEDEEDEEDRMFLQEMPETQVSPSYNQTLAYRQSLFTQAPAGANGPAFANGPVRRGIFGAGMAARRRPMVSSSPPREDDDEPNEYVMGSFVVDDDAEISYLSDD
ncbi:hypothetical protein D9615_005173 [Tricholomella constricta]|uniref:ATP-dependent DNA helicase n=1 Tax=Tricholomella constricta TaxID=117010 RepID=A0A8H5H628_9AGAR|nr:hypothetical protein D9615_005173 [Tricholomella constricta]